MKKHSKRYQEGSKKAEPEKVYSGAEAIAALKEVKAVKFDETVELACRLGVDLKKGELVVRGTAALPHGTGKKVRILALVKEAQAAEATEAGADFAGLDEYIAKISGGWYPGLFERCSPAGKNFGTTRLDAQPEKRYRYDYGRVGCQRIKSRSGGV